jgi:hypothetical protein
MSTYVVITTEQNGPTALLHAFAKHMENPLVCIKAFQTALKRKRIPFSAPAPVGTKRTRDEEEVQT